MTFLFKSLGRKGNGGKLRRSGTAELLEEIDTQVAGTVNGGFFASCRGHVQSTGVNKPGDVVNILEGVREIINSGMGNN